MSKKALADALAKLKAKIDSGKQAVPSSAFTAAQRKQLEGTPLQNGAIRLVKQGRGTKYEVLNLPIFSQLCAEYCDSELTEQQFGLNSRTQNILKSSNSKVGVSTLDKHYLVLKSASAQCIWRNTSSSAVVDVAELCTQLGSASVCITKDDYWQFDGELWFVENQAVFDDLSWLPSSATNLCIVYYAGNLSDKVVKWLAARPRATRVVLFPDYDGVGLENFCRLYDALPNKPDLFIMPGSEELVANYGNAEVWQNSLAKVEARRDHPALCATSAVASLVQTLFHRGKALEQEVILALDSLGS